MAGTLRDVQHCKSGEEEEGENSRGKKYREESTDLGKRVQASPAQSLGSANSLCLRRRKRRSDSETRLNVGL